MRWLSILSFTLKDHMKMKKEHAAQQAHASSGAKVE